MYILVIFFLSSPLPFSLPKHTPTHSVRSQGNDKRKEMKEERKKRDSTWLIKLDKVCFFQVSTDSLSPELTEVDREESRKKYDNGWKKV